MNYVKLLLVAIILSIPTITSLPGHHPVFDSFEEQRRSSEIRLKHGECAIYYDFTHFIRANNGEKCRLNKGEK